MKDVGGIVMAPTPAQYRIGKWLEYETNGVILDTWRIVSILHSKREEKKRNTFKIPHGEFCRKKLIFDDLKHVLLILTEKEVVKVYTKDKSPLSEPNYLTEYNPEIIRDKNTFIEIHPENFTYLKRELKEKLKESREAINNIAIRRDEKDNRLYCEEKAGIGYLKVGKYGQKIKIGKTTSQPFRLLQCLTEPFGTAKSIHTVFEAIRESLRGKRFELSDPYLSKAKKIQLIKNSGIKHLQKQKIQKQLKRKLKFKFDNLENKMWLECS